VLISIIDGEARSWLPLGAGLNFT